MIKVSTLVALSGNALAQNDSPIAPASATSARSGAPKLFGTVEDQFNQLMKDNANGGYRAIQQSNMGLVNGYGCWCYFENDNYKGKGTPVDAIDQYCKLLHQGYECIIMDFENTPFACIPWEVDYNSAYAGGYHPLGLQPGHIEDECDRINTVGTCQNAVCRVEGYFMQGFFTEAIFNMGIDTTKNHNNGFNPEDEANCPTIVHNPGQYDMECCGEYPKRFPYKDRDNNKCCGNSTYNPTMFVCCSDGSVGTSALNCP